MWVVTKSHLLFCSSGSRGAGWRNSCRTLGLPKGEKEKRKNSNGAQEDMPALRGLQESGLFLGISLYLTPTPVKAGGMQLSSTWVCWLGWLGLCWAALRGRGKLEKVIKMWFLLESAPVRAGKGWLFQDRIWITKHPSGSHPYQRMEPGLVSLPADAQTLPELSSLFRPKLQLFLKCPVSSLHWESTR